MPRSKHNFGLAYSSRVNCLFSVGGCSCQKIASLDETTSYSIKRNKWNKLAPFPFDLKGSAVCVIKEKWLYNLGGYTSDWSVGRLEIGEEGQGVERTHWQ